MKEVKHIVVEKSWAMPGDGPWKIMVILGALYAASEEHGVWQLDTWREDAKWEKVQCKAGSC